MQLNFGKWEGTELTLAYSFRFTETPFPTQETDCIRSAVNAQHREGYDNISLLSKETYKPGSKAAMHCSFEGLGCPELILVEKPERCKDGAVLYGACFEVVLYRGGINVWRHDMDGEHRCSWHKRLGLEYPVAENTIHELTVETREKELIFTLNGQKTTLRTEDLFPGFFWGITMCESVARVYDLTIEA